MKSLYPPLGYPMKTYPFITVGFTLFLLSSTKLAAGNFYVDDDIASPGTGKSWGDAFANLQDALAAASANDTIFVAEGTYYPDEGGASSDGDRHASFHLLDDVVIAGGFPDGGMGARNLAKNQTILSGDIDKNDSGAPAGGNSYSVVNGSGTQTTAILDGFIVMGGLADAADPEPFDGPTRAGAAIFNSGGRPTIRNCVFTNNLAGFGGGIFNDSPAGSPITVDPLLINCLFVGNKATAYGGGMNNRSGSFPTLVNCTFSANSADFAGGGGGAISNTSSSPSLINCIIWNNETIGSTSLVASSVSNGSTTSYAYCLVENIDPGGTNLDGTLSANDPDFLSPGDPFSAPSKGGNYRVTLGSPTLNFGDNTANTQNKDLRSKQRIADVTIDLGPYEGAVTASDADGDGLSDDFELAHTMPASNTSLAPDSNDDLDPFTALEEFAFGLDPNVPNGSEDGYILGFSEVALTDYLSITWAVNSDAFLLVDITPEQSSDLGVADTWSNGDTVPIITPSGKGSARSTSAVNSQDKDFLRVRVEKK